MSRWEIFRKWGSRLSSLKKIAVFIRCHFEQTALMPEFFKEIWGQSGKLSDILLNGAVILVYGATDEVIKRLETSFQ